MERLESGYCSAPASILTYYYYYALMPVCVVKQGIPRLGQKTQEVVRPKVEATSERLYMPKHQMMLRSVFVSADSVQSITAAAVTAKPTNTASASASASSHQPSARNA
jgi:hypothetical protein